jgi:hypothetical protein
VVILCCVFTDLQPRQNQKIFPWLNLERSDHPHIYAHLLAFETRLALMSVQEGGGSSANSMYRGPGCSNRGDFGCSGGGRDGSARGNYGGFSRGSGRGGHDMGNDKRPICQVCKKRGHMADRCWHMFEEDYVPDDRTTAAA